VSDPPQPPRRIVAEIPEDVERLVLHAMEKAPEDRPANADEFRRELLETAERLGLEHQALTSVPNFEALRNEGVESPSGRLVVDIKRVRALSSGSNEIKIVHRGHDSRSRVKDPKEVGSGSFLDKVKRILGRR
jgi:hypothetical protein